MDYEQFLLEAQICTKGVKEKTDIQSRAVKNMQKCLADGDLNALPKLFSILRDASNAREEALIRLEAVTSGFDGQE